MKRNFIKLIIGIIFIGIGSIVTVFEVMEYEFINEPYYDVSFVRKGEEKINIGSNDCLVIDLPHSDYHRNHTIIYEPDMGNEAIMHYTYLDGIYELDIYEEYGHNECKLIKVEYSYKGWNTKIRKLINNFVDNLKDKKIYNYFKNFNNDITIIVDPIYRDNVRFK